MVRSSAIVQAWTRTRLRRRSNRGHHHRAVIDAIVDEALICHVGFVAPHGPVVIPTIQVRVADTLYVHGSAVSAMLTTLATGVDACVTVTLLDALVYSRTAFHHSVNYRSVVAFGRATEVTDRDEKLASLYALIEKVEVGRTKACRMPNREGAGCDLRDRDAVDRGVGQDPHRAARAG